MKGTHTPTHPHTHTTPTCTHAQEVFDPYFSRRVAMMTFVFLGGVAGLVLCMLEVLLHRQQASRFMWK
jgi:hypothetical protein